MLYTVAIKRIEVKNASQGDEVLSAELHALHQCEHPNIVTLLAYNEDDKEMLLVYEYASNLSLEYQSESTNKETSFRQWTQRLKICIDVAKGLEYLHTKTKAKRVIVHRDIKSANILLFENMKAKIADLGLSKVHVGQESTINTNRLAGTNYYIDPEYANEGTLKKASDIYSFGVVLFEIFSGKLVFDETCMMKNDMCLVPIARTHFINGTLKEILDAELMDDASELGLTLKVCIDIARGLKFLHEGDVGQDVVIHKDIKSSNILLTIDWKAKIYGFKDAPNDVVGSAVYLDPSYYHTNDLTKESDIYSFGVVLFEILCGRMAFPEENSDDKQMLDCLVKNSHEAARVEEIVFEELKKHIVRKSFTIFRRIAFQCLQEKRDERPTANDVLKELEKALKFQEDYEERKVKLNRIYKEILDGKLDIYNILSKELLHEDDKLITHIIEQKKEEDQYLESDEEYYHSETFDEDYHSEPNDEDAEM
ncbi:hypothetical protein R6Q57_020453 [Mikania cordata]